MMGRTGRIFSIETDRNLIETGRNIFSIEIEILSTETKRNTQELKL